jgi:transposase
VPQNYILRLSGSQKKELLTFMKNTKDKEEYRRASAIKQKMEEGISYRNIARNVDVNYRNVYDWINNYRKDGLDGIRNKRKNGWR